MTSRGARDPTSPRLRGAGEGRGDRNRRILIVDDNRSIHDDFRKILCPTIASSSALAAREAALFGDSVNKVKRELFEMDSAFQGEDGIALVAKAVEEGRPYAVAFVDVRMPPGLDGVETTMKIWEMDRNIQVVICTAYSDYSWNEMSNKIGGCDGWLILKKPFDTLEALQLTEALTEKWRLHKQYRSRIVDLERVVSDRVDALRKTNEVLRESEERYRMLFEDARDGIALAEADTGQLVNCNRALCHMVERDEEELVGQAQSILHPPEKNSEGATHSFREHRTGYAGVALEDCLLSKSGRLIPVEIRASKIWMNGRDYLLGIFRDISERERAQNALRESEERFRIFFERSRDAIMTLQPPLWRFTSANSATVSMFRAADEKDFTTHEPWALSPERQPDGHDSRDKAGEMIETAMREGSSFFEWTHRRIDGEEFPATVLLTRMDIGGKPILLATVRDITESKRAIEAIEKSEKSLRGLNETKSRFVANASHELRTPLGIIRQFVYLLDSGIAGPLVDKQKDCTAAALRNCDRLAKLINRMLDLARIEAGRLNVERSIVEPGLLLNQSYADFLPKAEIKKHRLVLEVSDDLPAVYCDPQTITSVIMELLGNAYKFTPEGGQITLGCKQEGQFISVNVQDEGPGVSQEDQKRIFEAFAQVDRQPGPGAKGTGLGLTIIREIVQLNGGSISVASTPGKGSCFSFTIPVFDAKEQIAHRVLVVDDDMKAVETITEDLKRSGLNLDVKTASTGLQALIIAGTFHPHLVILDVYLPDSVTTDVFGSLGGQSPEKRGKILVISGEQTRLETMVEQGADDFLVKPFSGSDLIEKVTTLLGD
jgi:PAS domain S-box-containing protein